MSASNFKTFYGFIEAKDNDGQPLHITEFDPGGATVYGWTEETWLRLAPLHGIKPATPATFRVQTKDSLEPLTRATFWNIVQADRLPSGVDVFWADFQFGSGGATRELQAALGVRPDGVVGPVTLARIASCPDLKRLLDRFLAARIAYYDECGFRSRWPGLYRRANACHALALSLVVQPVPPAQVAA